MFGCLTLTCHNPYSPFFFGPFFWESSSPFFSSPESSDLAFRFSLLSSMISLFSFDSFLVVVVVFLGPWMGKRFKNRWTLRKELYKPFKKVHQRRLETYPNKRRIIPVQETWNNDGWKKKSTAVTVSYAYTSKQNFRRLKHAQHYSQKKNTHTLDPSHKRW